ncbi:MAG: YhdH/YhfP family quinone oxidoreductase [Caldilineaceae bacterium]|nr:YhdH/YhfP family quinone oxidoreductase [Caldilineaceae bacterium]
MSTQFRAFWVEEKQDGVFARSIITRTVDDLPPGDVLIRVHFSSLNYKDALSATGNKGVTRKYPHTPGIDAAGLVVESSAPHLQAGDPVVVIGYDLGMNTPGGFGQYIRVPAAWVVKLPPTLTPADSMAIGTAGFTAGMSVEALQAQGIAPGDGEVLVTGATGGVGSVAVALLAQLGYTVVAATGKQESGDYLHELGATTVIERSEVDDPSGRPMLKERWAGVVDTVGGNPLVTALKATRYGGAVTACGNVASPKIEMTVFPFILRGVKLLGIDSVNCPLADRRRLWAKFAAEWRLPMLDHMVRRVGLEDLDHEINLILHGGQIGRIVVAHKP